MFSVNPPGALQALRAPAFWPRPFLHSRGTSSLVTSRMALWNRGDCLQRLHVPEAISAQQSLVPCPSLSRSHMDLRTLCCGVQGARYAALLKVSLRFLASGNRMREVGARELSQAAVQES